MLKQTTCSGRARAEDNGCGLQHRAPAASIGSAGPTPVSDHRGHVRPERIDKTVELAAVPIPEALWEELTYLTAPEATWPK